MEENKFTLVDSHCHLHLIDLSHFESSLDNVLNRAKEAQVERVLSVSVALDDLPRLIHLAEIYPMVSISVGAHPHAENLAALKAEELIQLATHPSCIAIGETGLDYYRQEELPSKEDQQSAFRAHIGAALAVSKPLIIHTRQAGADTIKIMQEESASQIGGVMHCFTETWDLAKKALDLNFYISFSGIITFKSATELRELARKIPADRILIETDSPYLAPVPFRGKENHPALVAHVAETLAMLRGMDYARFAEETTQNFYRCFRMGT